VSVRELRSTIVLFALCVVPIGCGYEEVDTTYGRSRGKSINGTGVFVELLRQRGHEVRTAVRATKTLSEWANVVVRFAGQPGPPDVKEGKWLNEWLRGSPGRKVVYIPCDYDAEFEFWEAMLAAEPKNAKPEEIDRVKKKRDLAKSWVKELPPKSKDPVNSADWFAVDPKPGDPATCKTLDGPWAEDVVAASAAVAKHEALKVDLDESILLSGDGSPLVVSWNLDNGSQVLVVANASFLLNASLLNHARRPLAMKVADWIGSTPFQIALIERRGWLGGEEDDASSPYHLLKVPPFGWVVSQLLAFLLLLALSKAVRLGRPRPEPPSGVERPAAHAEALGALLAKTGRADIARFLLESYRRWRHHSHVAGRSAPTHPPTR
jgi:hypothetical protein